MYSTVVCLCCRNKFPKNEGILPNKMEFEKPDISFSQLRFFVFRQLINRPVAVYCSLWASAHGGKWCQLTPLENG